MIFSVFQGSLFEVKASTLDGSGARSYTDTSSGDVFLGGKYIEIGITKEGSLGTVNSAPTSSTPVIDDVTGRLIYFHPDATGNDPKKLGMVTNADANGAEKGWNSITCDFFMPWLVNESWMLGWDNVLKAKGCIGGYSGYTSVGNFTATTVNKSTTQLLCAETTIVTAENIKIVQTISFKPEDKFFKTYVEITNQSAVDLTDVRFMRSFDPDQGRLNGGENVTSRVIGHEELDAKGVSVIASKTDGTAPFIYFTTDKRATVGWSDNYDTTLFSVESEVASGKAHIEHGANEVVDGNIFVYYDFPTFNSGETVKISYFSSLDTNLESAIEGMLSLDISSEEIEAELINRPEESVSAYVSASITGVDLSTCSVSYRWYISDSPNVIETGKIISGADTGKYTFVPTGNKEDIGVYYLCCEVTAVSGEQSVTKCSKNLIVMVYNAYDLNYDSNGGDGSVIGRTDIREGDACTVADGKALDAPEGMHFKKWNTKADGTGVSYQSGDKITMTESITLYAQWEPDVIDIDFYVYLNEEEIRDNSQYKVYIVSEEETIEMTYGEKGWDAQIFPGTYNIEVYLAEEEVVIGRTEMFEPDITPYEVELHLYTVHWDTDADDTVDESVIYKEGDMPSHADGEKEESDQYYYIFTGWDKEMAKVSGEETYTAQFEEHVKKYKIEWDVDGDGRADSAEQLDYGVLPENLEAEKRADYQYTYSFIGWSPAIEPVTRNQMYSAVFDKVLRQYKVIWPKNMIGYEIIPEEGSQNPVNYNGSYAFGIKIKQGYDSSTLIVTANGRVLTAKDGIYTISSIGRDGKDVQMEVTIADNTAPTGTIYVNTDSWTTLQKEISFDKFYTTMQGVRIEASDEGGGIQSVSYYVSEEAIDESALQNLTWMPYVSNFYINPDMRGIIYAKIVDVEGNITYLSTCGLVLEAPYDSNDVWKYEEVTKFEEYIYKHTSDEDVKGSIYNKVRARVISQKQTQQTLKWNKVTDADGYIIYGNRCNSGSRIYKKKKLKTITNPQKTKWTHKKLKKATYYKYVVVAYKKIDGKKKVLSVSKCVHAVTAGGKYQNPTNVKIKQKNITLRVGKKKKIKATRVMPKGGRMKEHTERFRYESSNKKIVTVDKKGRIKGKKAGTCYVFVYIQNGIYKMIKVRVK